MQKKSHLAAWTKRSAPHWWSGPTTTETTKAGFTRTIPSSKAKVGKATALQVQTNTSTTVNLKKESTRTSLTNSDSTAVSSDRYSSDENFDYSKNKLSTQDDTMIDQDFNKHNYLNLASNNKRNKRKNQDKNGFAIRKKKY